MASCVLRICNSRGRVDKKKLTGITFHRFPKDSERRKLWIEFVNRPNWEPSIYSTLCSKHFLEQYFDRSSLCYVRLKDNAVPTINGYQEVKFQETSKIRILSNIQIRPPASNSIAVFPNIPTSISVTSHTTTDESTSSVGSSGSSSTDLVTPRKRKILNKLYKTEKVSGERRRKLKNTRRKLFRREKRIADMKAIITEIKKKNFIQEETLDVLEKLGGPKELFLRQYSKHVEQRLPNKYSEELKTFALTLHYYSPAAYNYVRRTFDTCLPHTRTLCRWYQSIDGEPGFTKEAFDALRLKVTASDGKVLCSLIMDEMAIRQQEEWVPSKNKCYGYVDMGTGLNEQTLAKDALVLLLNCINGSWKIPVGYFLIAGITGDQKKGLVLDCLQKCHEVGVDVVSLTFDGAPVNLTMAKRLGCNLDHNNLKTSFQHPSTGKDVVIILDPSHMMKLVRNTIGEKKSLVDESNGIIDWKYFKELHNLQENESFHLANKLRAQHVNFYRQKMKVSLATQLFSESIAVAMEFCSNQLSLPEFIGVDATVRFVRIMNNLFDILNSRNLLQLGFKKPLLSDSYPEVNEFLIEADMYINNLRTHLNGVSILDSERHTGFLGLKICIASLRILFNQLISAQVLKFLPFYKFSQDHIELFFSSIRSKGGYNNNPSARHFQSAYKKMLVHVELRENFRGNCIPLEHLNILKCEPVHHINITSQEHRLLDIHSIDISDEMVELEHDYFADPFSQYSKYIITYIAGYVVYYLQKRIICSECLSVLTSENRDLNVYSFINKKEQKNLQYPAEDVLEICFTCEKIIKNFLSAHNSISKERITYIVLEKFVNTNIFSNLIVHSFEHSVFDNHRILLLKSIINRYIDIRMYYICKNKMNRSLSIRQHSNKIVLFRGQ